jgi:hypothetical protein
MPAQTKGACSEYEVNAAIFSQKPLIAHQIKERLQQQRRYMMRRIKEGERLDPHDDSRTLILSKGLPSTVGYGSYADPYPDTCDGPDLKEGYQPGQDSCNNGCGSVQIKTLVNETERNACDGVCIVDYSQGFRYKGFEDAVIKIATPERCIETLAKRERKHVLDYIEQEAEYLSETAFLSFDRKLVELGISHGGANSVVRSHIYGEPVLTEGGWSPGPNPNDATLGVKHASLYWLCRYREQIIERMLSASVPNAEDYVLEIEVTREAWKFMLIAESLNRTSDGGMLQGLGEQIRLNADFNESIYGKNDALYGRKFDTWYGKIRAVFSDNPIRGFLRPNGATFDFIRVYHSINVPDEAAGVRTIPNPDYRRNQVTCDGIEYPLFELIPHVHADSFMRHNLTQGPSPSGVTPIGTNFEIQLLKDGDLSSKDCPNWGNKKYRYYLEHKFRFRDIRNEYSGFILHRRQIMPGYDINVDDRALVLREEAITAIHPGCDDCDEELCNPECELLDVCLPGDNITRLSPCGPVKTSFYGTPRIVAFDICREEECADCDNCIASVAYTFAAGTALAGVHYVVVDENNVPAPASGTVTWVDGDWGCRKVYARIVGALADTQPVPSAIPCCDDEEAIKNDAVFTLTISAPSDTTLAACKTTTVSIRNRVQP